MSFYRQWKRRSRKCAKSRWYVISMPYISTPILHNISIAHYGHEFYNGLNLMGDFDHRDPGHSN
jgi:hypothetical protein